MRERYHFRLSFLILLARAVTATATHYALSVVGRLAAYLEMVTGFLRIPTLDLDLAILVLINVEDEKEITFLYVFKISKVFSLFNSNNFYLFIICYCCASYE